MMRARGVMVLLAVLLAPGVDIAQEATALVVIIRGDQTFHQPGCALVAKAGSSVAIAKRGEAIRRDLTPHDCGPDASGGPPADPNAVKVVTQSRDNKYHKATCPKLGATRSTLTLEEAGRKLWPCPACKPPIRQRKLPTS